MSDPVSSTPDDLPAVFLVSQIGAQLVTPVLLPFLKPTQALLAPDFD
jgi:hypothetical protein